LTPLRETTLQLENRIYDATDVKFGTTFTTLMQGLSDAIPREDTYGMATAMSFVGTWDGWNKGGPKQGELTLELQARWDWGTTAPNDLGNLGLGSLGFTSNQFAAYTPTFLVRNLFWRQGSREAGWMYRIGRITPDAMLASSTHINGLINFLPISGTGPFAMGISDSGLGVAAGKFVNDRVNVLGIFSDANADRFDFGDIDEGDIFSALELQVKVLPLTDNAGYSTFSFWHNDGTKFGQASNGGTGKEGWGWFIKHEQELTCDGRAIVIARVGRSYKESALYDQLAGVSFVLYDPFNSGKFEDTLFESDLVGLAYSWVQPSAVDRDESNAEIFYRFPLFPHFDATLSYQAIINPALDPSNDFGSAFSLRFRSTW
jgi:hypothetical protein